MSIIRGLTFACSPAKHERLMSTSKKTVDELLRERLRTLGAMGGKKAAKQLSKEARSAKAKKAAAARWGKKKPPKGQ